MLAETSWAISLGYNILQIVKLMAGYISKIIYVNEIKISYILKVNALHFNEIYRLIYLCYVAEIRLTQSFAANFI